MGGAQFCKGVAAPLHADQKGSNVAEGQQPCAAVAAQLWSAAGCSCFLALGTIASAQASKMLLVLPLCALFTSFGRAAGNAARSHAAN